METITKPSFNTHMLQLSNTMHQALLANDSTDLRNEAVAMLKLTYENITDIDKEWKETTLERINDLLVCYFNAKPLLAVV